MERTVARLPRKAQIFRRALDCELGLPEGFYLNELRRAMNGHVLDQASVELPSRA